MVIPRSSYMGCSGLPTCLHFVWLPAGMLELPPDTVGSCHLLVSLCGSVPTFALNLYTMPPSHPTAVVIPTTTCRFPYRTILQDALDPTVPEQFYLHLRFSSLSHRTAVSNSPGYMSLTEPVMSGKEDASNSTVWFVVDTNTLDLVSSSLVAILPRYWTAIRSPLPLNIIPTWWFSAYPSPISTTERCCCLVRLEERKYVLSSYHVGILLPHTCLWLGVGCDSPLPLQTHHQCPDHCCYSCLPWVGSRKYLCYLPQPVLPTPLVLLNSISTMPTRCLGVEGQEEGKREGRKKEENSGWNIFFILYSTLYPSPYLLTYYYYSSRAQDPSHLEKLFFPAFPRKKKRKKEGEEGATCIITPTILEHSCHLLQPNSHTGRFVAAQVCQALIPGWIAQTWNL